MKKTAVFYAESLAITVVFVAVILIVTMVFGRAKTMSADAKKLTTAVELSENAAEVFAAEPSIARMRELMDEGNLEAVSDGPQRFRAYYDEGGSPDPDGVLRVTAVVTETETGLCYCDITVVNERNGQEIYKLRTAAQKGGTAK